MDVREKSSSKKRLIDAEKLLESYKKWIPQLSSKEDEGDRRGVETCIAVLEDMPTIDAVEVVRCRECKKGEVDDPDFPDEYYCHAGCGWNNGDFYCSYGERKEGADNG